MKTEQDHDGAGQAPDSGSQKAIETDETRAAEALEEQNSRRSFEARDAEPKVEIDQPDPESMFITPDPALRLAPLYAALAKAQGAFPDIPRNRTATIRPQSGEKWSYKYSDLSDLIKAVRKPLADNGLGFYQYPTEDGKSLATVVFHSTGLDVTTSYPMHQTSGGRMHPAQNYSVGGTYAKRNGLSAALGVASEETVEGDRSEKTSEDFQSGGGDGVLSVRGVVVPPGATKAEKAKLFATAIEGKLDEASTEVGLEGVWSRNVDVINTFQDFYPELHQNLLDVYQRCLDAVREG